MKVLAKLIFLLINVAFICTLPSQTKNTDVQCGQHKDILTYTHCITKRNVNRCMGNSCVSCRNGGCQTTCTGSACASCPTGGCCNGENCNVCAGTSCCSTPSCNTCVNSCQSGCNSLQCQNSCVQQCQTCNNCQQNECCRSENNCFSNCMRQCNTDECYQTCIKNCIVPERIINTCNCTTPQPCCGSNGSVDITNVLKEQRAVNITTIINLKNYINNTNIVNNPINVTSHNINHIHLVQASKKSESGKHTTVIERIVGNTTCEKEKCPDRRCCYVIQPTHCFNIPEPPYMKCIRRRHFECSSICSSVVVHVVHVPKPYPVAYPVYRPVCHYVQQYPWVRCGHYGVQDCGSCYYCRGAYNPRYCRLQGDCATLCRGDIFYRSNDAAFQTFVERNYPTYRTCGPTCYANEPVGQTPIQIPQGAYIAPQHVEPLQQPGGCPQIGGCPSQGLHPGSGFEQVHAMPQMRNMQ